MMAAKIDNFIFSERFWCIIKEIKISQNTFKIKTLQPLIFTVLFFEIWEKIKR